MTIGRFVVLAITGAALAGCSGTPFDDPFEQNLTRSQTITLSAGNAAKSNEAIQVIDPWPSYVVRHAYPWRRSKTGGGRQPL